VFWTFCWCSLNSQSAQKMEVSSLESSARRVHVLLTNWRGRNEQFVELDDLHKSCTSSIRINSM
jgi:hypothetical protein